ncbi:uncharacterized protein LOC107798024 isoform X2 [Nicotiana tabacum]|nr:uncharacterized protein LOC104121485 isoform X2 [Nicotiana tomentosiformis]XP_016476438.1 PREDICTED: uncharacterized protein LOC107798024 isoform X2 [Nicotiana tabacum]
MEEDQVMKFVCKLCNKRYPCGKSLGGHMRSHVLANSAEFEENFEAKLKKVQSWSNINGKNFKRENQSKLELGGVSSYGLRENPKKTWRAEDSNFPLPQEKVCQQCGKVFQSLKALCGHMACHSEKDKGCLNLKDDNSWTSESNSDTEAEELFSPKCRSKTKRYKKIIVKSSICKVNNNYNCSSSVSEIDHEQEQEEVAKCLMMLSRDSGIWNGVNIVVESSDNNSVVLETKSSSNDMRNARNNTLKRAYNQDEKPQTKKKEDRDLKRDILEAETQSENSDSDYFLGENGKVDSDGSVERFRGNGNCKWSSSKMSLGAWLDERRHDEKKSLNRIKRYLTESRKDLSKKYEHDGYGLASNFDKCESRKGTTDRYKNIHKKRKYECLNCKKTFSSYQALGGHRPCHKKINDYSESTYETGENSLGADNDPKYINIGKHKETFSNKKPAVSTQDVPYEPEKKVKPKKSKGHKCPFCPRIFKSGQALGGHKRSHFIHASVNEENLNQSSAVKREVADLLDLNLPAPVDDEDDEHEHARFMS